DRRVQPGAPGLARWDRHVFPVGTDRREADLDVSRGVSLAATTTHMDLGLTNKIVMVGGASKGLGYAVARALAGEGAPVCIASRAGSAVRRAAETIAAETGARVHPVAADLATADAVARWHDETIKTFGGVDALFANTGGPPAGAVLDFDDAAWRGAFELLLMS